MHKDLHGDDADDSSKSSREEGADDRAMAAYSKQFKGHCHKCGKMGHKSADCYSRSGGKTVVVPIEAEEEAEVASKVEGAMAEAVVEDHPAADPITSKGNAIIVASMVTRQLIVEATTARMTELTGQH